MPELDVKGEVTTEGELSILLTPQPPDWERMLAELHARKDRGGTDPETRLYGSDEIGWFTLAELEERKKTARRVKAPWTWRARNWLRMLAYGELWTIPVAVRLLKTCRWLDRWRVVRLTPIFGWIVGGVASMSVLSHDLYAEHYHAASNTIYDCGLVGRRTVLTAGKNYLAACFPNTNEPELLKYHAFGTGTTAPTAADTALQTELTTEYNPNSTRPTGSQSALTNTYTTAATLTPDSGTPAVTEWGLATQAATGGGTFLDRQTFAAINLTGGSGDSLTTTYTFTVN